MQTHLYINNDPYPEFWVEPKRALMNKLEGIPSSLSMLDIHKCSDEIMVYLWTEKEDELIKILTRIKPEIYRKYGIKKILRRIHNDDPVLVNKKQLQGLCESVFKFQRYSGPFDLIKKDILRLWIELWVKSYGFYRKKEVVCYEKTQE